MDSLNDLPALVRLIVALGFVVALMGGLALALKRLGLAGVQAEKSGKSKRLKVVERLQLDARRQVVLIARDDVHHLLVLGANGEVLVESNIQEKKHGKKA